MPCERSLRSRHRADAPQRVDRKALQKALDAFGRDDRQPVRLLPAGGNLGEELVGRHARRGRQACLVADADLQPLGHGAPQRQAPGVVGDVEVRLVERERFDQRRHLAIDREDLQRHRAVFLELGSDDDQVRAEADGMRHRHGRPDAELAGFVAGRRDDTPAGRRAAHHHRPSPQRRVVALLHGCIEGIHVYVENPSHCRLSDCRLQITKCRGCQPPSFVNFVNRAIVNLQSSIDYPYASVLYRSFGTPISLTAAETVSMNRGVGSTPFSRAAARSCEDSAGPHA